ncbi:response regulator [Pedobacter sp. P351]|uniref:response regulator n=1 Tax=Pedobacter superstes TaxID=3133441 RepID=UPI0030A18E46
MYKIFVIDDCPLNLVLAKIIIKKHGFFTATCFSEAQLALDYIACNQNDSINLPDVILLDLNMPVMDGWQFLAKFEEQLPLVKVIGVYMLSSSTDLRDVQRAKQYQSVKEFFTKPLSTEMLNEIMISSLATAS